MKKILKTISIFYNLEYIYLFCDIFVPNPTSFLIRKGEFCQETMEGDFVKTRGKKRKLNNLFELRSTNQT